MAATKPEPDLPKLKIDQLLEDLRRLSSNPTLEQQLSATLTVENEQLDNPTSAALEPRPSQPENISEAVKCAVQLITLDGQLKQRGSDVEARQIGDRLESNQRRIDELLRALQHTNIISSPGFGSEAVAGLEPQ